MQREKPPELETNKPNRAFGKASSGGQDKIFVPGHLQETFFAFLTIVKQEGGETLNETGCAFLDEVLKNGRRIGEKEFAALYRLALSKGPAGLGEMLDAKFVFDNGMVSLREPTLLKSSYEGMKWPASHESE